MTCTKCGVELDVNARFCMECGTPVPQEKECPKCKTKLPLNAKFCLSCGFNFNSGSQNNSRISMGDKNVVAGDVIGKKEEYKISGSATIVHNEDETKKTAKCHICGSVVQRISGYDCPSCGDFTCEDCFDRTHGTCKNCVEKNIKNKEQQYRKKVEECLADDNRIDAKEFQELKQLAHQLGIEESRAVELQNEVRKSSSVKELTTFEKLNFEKAMDLFYDEGNSEEALNLLEPIYNSHKEDDQILNLYLPVLAEEKPDEAKKIITEMKFDNLGAYLTAIEIAIREKDMATAERKVERAAQFWPENIVVKCHRILYRLALYEYFDSQEWLKKAEELIPELGKASNKLELSWMVKVQVMVDEAKGKKTFELDREYCKNYQLFYEFIRRNILKSREELEKESLQKYDMVYVAGGTLILGNDEEEDNPEHKVTLDSFFISKYQVTQEVYEKVTGDNPSYFKGKNKPVENICWYDAVEFCNKLSLMEGLTPCYTIDKNKKDINNKNDFDEMKWTVNCNFRANGYRLPTEAEWEYAAKGGQKSQGYKFAGSDDIDEIAWYGKNSDDETHEVGKKKPNELGIYDMSGNVWEWCWDWYGDSTVDGDNPIGPASGSCRVLRGGCYYNFDYYCAVSYRNYYSPYDCDDSFGFRLARSSSK